MFPLIETINAVGLLSCFALLGTSRIGACIRWLSLQGILFGLVPLIVHQDGLTVREVVLAAGNVCLKGIIFPLVLLRLRARAGYSREVQPFVSFIMSILFGVLALALLPLAWAVYRAVEPWSRADCAGAARYVLTHRQPGDVVAANHWEYAYYFRHLGAGFSLLEDTNPNLAGRLWLVTTAVAPRDRLEILHVFCRQGWKMLEQQEFKRTSVYLLSRSISRGSSE